MNDLGTRIKELSETEKIFFLATTQFRDSIKSMYSISVSLSALIYNLILIIVSQVL